MASTQPGTPRRIELSFPDAELDRLQAKLDDARLPSRPIVEGARDVKEYGTDLDTLRRFLDHWKLGNPLDHTQRPVGEAAQGVKKWWRSVEQRLNDYPHYQVEIEGITVHYQHYKPDRPSSTPRIPLIFSHGWPGSFTEAEPFARQLVSSSASPAFEVVVPSLPGYGLSSQPPRPGWTLVDTARVFNTLMTSVLGFESYMAQGGDWGSIVTRCLATYPACRIYHTNFAPPTTLPYWIYPALALEKLAGIDVKNLMGWLGYSEIERLALKRSQEYQDVGSAYVNIQSTRPATLGYALYDEPVGILSWLLEKFEAWSDPACPAFAGAGKANAESHVSEEAILIDAMIYYLTGSVHTSFLPYKDSHHLWFKPGLRLLEPVRSKPYAHSAFKWEILGGPRSWLSSRYFHLVQYREHHSGGHFAALDNPTALADDVQQFAQMWWTKSDPSLAGGVV